MRRTTKKSRHHLPWADRNGQSLILVVLAMTVLMSMAAAGITVGNLYYAKTRLQNAADAAALAGAQDAVNQNYSAVAGESQLIPQNSPGGQGSLILNQANQTVTATATTKVSPSFAGALGFGAFTVNTKAIASYSGGAAFDYALFQGDTNPSNGLTLTGDSRVYGSVHSNDGLSLGGNASVTDGCTAGAGQTIQGGTCGGGNGTSGYVPMPQWIPSQIPNPILLTSTSITASLPPGNYYAENENITISGNVSLSGSITVYNGTITISGTSSITNSSSGGLALASFGSPSGITYNGTDTIDGFLYAPNGTITMHGGGHGEVNGAVVAEDIETDTGHMKISWNPTETSAAPVHQVVLLQ